MLIQFLVENFLSFKDETVFSMLAPPEETRGVVDVPAHGLRLMRIAAFYGANASGKSNLITAMETARRLIANEQSSDAKLPAHFFRLEPATLSKPSRFQFDFIVAEIRYTYVLSFTNHAIAAEALYRKLPNVTDEEMVYEREGVGTDGQPIVTFGPMVKTGEKGLQFAEFTARGTHTKKPLLLQFAIGNVPGFEPIRRWFDTDLKLIGADTAYEDLIPELNRSSKMRLFFSEMLTKLGTGIRNIEIKKHQSDKMTGAFQLIQQYAGTRKILDQGKSILVGPSKLNTGISFETDGDRSTILELKLWHANRAGFDAEFSLDDESDGTRRLLHLLPVLWYRNQESSVCTIIDELDRSLHTTLTRHFVQEFFNVTDETQSQLIFTTHDTNLLNGHLLPPSGIWFVEKDDDGASRIYSLSEYKPDQLKQLLERLEEGYLQGRFGAIPFIADRKTLGWQSDEEKPKA